MSHIRSLQRYWHTLRYLRPVQIYGRLWHRLYRPSPRLRGQVGLRLAEGLWTGCQRIPTQIGPNRFRFLNVERELQRASDWNHSQWPKLWLYNLHYFDDLAASDGAARNDWHRALICRWLVENPPGQGNGWESYPVSLRLVNWCKWLLQGNAPVPGMVESLAVQAHWLRRRLEHHLLGNHLWANLKALLFVGACLEVREGAGWSRHALKLFRRELDEQILPDGGHFERSPMYHAILLEDLLDLVQLARLYPDALQWEDVARWRNRSSAMLAWLHAMTHPDGRPGLFNDTAFGIAPEWAALRAYAADQDVEAGVPAADNLVALRESGYFRMQYGDAVALLDCAPIGQDYLPGHAHADTLSFEFSLHGKRVLVNGGNSTYEANEQRERERSTAMHNTVEVDGQDSSEVWSAFRVARRARIIECGFDQSQEAQRVAAAHDGYRRLSGRVDHYREWQLLPGQLTITDRLTGQWCQAIARFRLAPEVQVASVSGEGVELALEGRRIDFVVQGARQLAVEEGTWHPEFGLCLPCKVLAVAMDGPKLQTRLKWAD